MFSHIQSLFTPEGLLSLLISLPCILISLSLHEYAHGWVAHKCGDDTALNFGRLTFNPIKHLDPMGTLCMVLFGFGWAKPVPVNPRYFKNPKRDFALVAAAGPLTNLILAFIGAILYGLFIVITSYLPAMNQFGQKICEIFATMLFTFHWLNISLAIFNLIPLPPLDGSRILYLFLPPKWYFGVMKYEYYIKIAFLLLLWLDIISISLGRIVYPISYGMLWIVNSVFSIFI